jgi:Flp pilus assembly pilin Flp
MMPNSKTDLSGRPSRKREIGQTVIEYEVVITVITVSVMALFVILSGGVVRAIDRAVGLIP